VGEEAAGRCMIFTRVSQRNPFRKRTALAALNETLADKGLTLHPTKGYRKISLAKSVASQITEQMKRGDGWYPLIRVRYEIRKALLDDRTHHRNQPDTAAAQSPAAHSEDRQHHGA
jgi:hypothetical protein